MTLAQKAYPAVTVLLTDQGLLVAMPAKTMYTVSSYEASTIEILKASESGMKAGFATAADIGPRNASRLTWSTTRILTAGDQFCLLVSSLVC